MYNKQMTFRGLAFSMGIEEEDLAAQMRAEQDDEDARFSAATRELEAQFPGTNWYAGLRAAWRGDGDTIQFSSPERKAAFWAAMKKYGLE